MNDINKQTSENHKRTPAMSDIKTNKRAAPSLSGTTADKSKLSLHSLRKLFGKIPKKAWVGAAIVMIVAIGIWAIGSGGKPKQAIVQSENGNIELLDAKAGMTIANGSPIKGTLTPHKDATLYYIVSSEDKRALGAGNITTGEGNHFSRNLTFDANNYKGKKGELQVYIQDKDGKVIDRIKTTVRFE